MTGPRFLGLDLGGTNVKTVVLESGEGGYREVASATAPTLAQRGPEAVVARLVELGREAVKTHGPVARAGLGVPGLFDPATGRAVLIPNLPGPWPGQPLREPLAAGLGVPVTLVNDARAFTLAEARMGAGRGCRTLVGVTLGTGVGGGLVVDGRLHLGAWGVAGELGHQTVLPDGPRCGCGNRGCVEALAKGEALAALAGRPTPEDVFAGVREGDRRCREAVATVAGYLGIALANLVTVLGPERIVVGGGIATAGELILGPIREAIRRRLSLVPPDEVVVVGAALGPTAGAIGAALAAAEGL
ncbi:MAG TPA: ROK family protein [Actinomycetota bacterium]|nr:ROK family protein [Actinomycetota bacterium]